jgi:hypothetical protein
VSLFPSLEFPPRMKAIPLTVVFLPDHQTLIEACKVHDDTLNVDQIPELVQIGQNDLGQNWSLWVWIDPNRDINMFSLICDFTQDSTDYIGIEFARCMYNAVTITAKDKKASLPFVTTPETGAIGYVAFNWPKS